MSKPKKEDEFDYVPEEDSGVFEKKLKKIKAKLKFCEKERAEYLAGWQRAKADLINYKKEQEKKISDYYKFANEGLILEILAVLDSFELALKHKKDDPKTALQFGQDGIQQLYNQLRHILKSHGLEEIKALGEKFNPEFHEAVSEAHSEPSRRIKEEKVVEEIQKGYKLNGKVIRPSRVKISK